jgi:hypothetical protein
MQWFYYVMHDFACAELMPNYYIASELFCTQFVSFPIPTLLPGTPQDRVDRQQRFDQQL